MSKPPRPAPPGDDDAAVERARKALKEWGWFFVRSRPDHMEALRAALKAAMEGE